MPEIISRETRVDWAAIFAGAVVATAIGVILSTFGLGLGLAVNSPYEGEGASPALFAIGAGVWLLAIQVLAFWAGGYICARLRARQPELSEHEVDVRDGLHGIIVWGVGVLAAGFIASVVLGSATTAAENADRGGIVESVTAAADAELDQSATRERAENPEAVGESFTERRAEVARKASVISTFVTAASLLVGAVAAFFAAGVGGAHRDKGAHVKFFTVRRPIRSAVVPPTTPVV
jgi:MFS family permease